ncbi:MAG TPA: 50S ribosomal protein L30 [Thermoplasmata archaeon]|nr:50S ribosomal protein L30 [Thermoplasmata archaeon]
MGWMVIRVRGGIHARRDIVETLDLLHLTRPNHATVLPESTSARGMLLKVQGYVTWGEAEPETLGLLLAQRGESRSGTRLEAALPGAPKGSGVDLPGLAREVLTSGLAHAEAVRPLFRLKPPKGGWKSTKRPFALGGALGYRGRAINDLARKML